MVILVARIFLYTNSTELLVIICLLCKEKLRCVSVHAPTVFELIVSRQILFDYWTLETIRLISKTNITLTVCSSMFSKYFQLANIWFKLQIAYQTKWELLFEVKIISYTHRKLYIYWFSQILFDIIRF